MKGFIEVKEDSYEDAIEHLHRIKALICKLIKMLSYYSDEYEKEEEEYEDKEAVTKSRSGRSSRGRYDY